MTELIVLYRMPNDPERFDKYYREVHGPITSKLPGLKGYKYGPARALDGGPGEFFWYWCGTFDSTELPSMPWRRRKARRALPTCQTIIMMIRSSCSSKIKPPDPMTRRFQSARGRIPISFAQAARFWVRPS